jgi:hypothetical protein
MRRSGANLLVADAGTVVPPFQGIPRQHLLGSNGGLDMQFFPGLVLTILPPYLLRGQRRVFNRELGSDIEPNDKKSTNHKSSGKQYVVSTGGSKHASSTQFNHGTMAIMAIFGVLCPMGIY